MPDDPERRCPECGDTILEELWAVLPRHTEQGDCGSFTVIRCPHCRKMSRGILWDPVEQAVAA